MSVPPIPYTRQANFTNFATEQFPTTGQDLEAEFNKLAQSVGSTQSRLAEIQRDDGLLANLSVHPDSLSHAVRSLLAAEAGVPRGNWAPGVIYQPKDVVMHDGASYLAATEHTAGADFDADLAAGKWLLLSFANDGGTLRSDLASPTYGNGASLVQYDDDETVKDRLDALASDAGASWVGFKQAGTGAVTRTALDKLRSMPIHAADFGAVGDGITDDAPAINAALAAANARGGGDVLLEAKTYRILSTIDNKYNRVRLVGVGTTSFADSGVPEPRTVILADFVGTAMKLRTPFAAEQGVPVSQTKKNLGGAIVGIEIRGNLKATKALEVNSVAHAEVDVYATEFVGTTVFEVTCGVTGTDLGSAADVQHCRLKFRARQIDNAAERGSHILTLNGSVNANVSLNRGPLCGIYVAAQWANGHLLYGISADNNDIVLVGHRVSDGTGKTVYACAPRDPYNVGFDTNTLTYVGGRGEIFAEGTDAPGAKMAIHNRILCRDDGNATPAPTAGAGSVWSETTAYNISSGFAFNKTAFSDSVASANTARTAMGLETIRVRNSSGAHMVLEDGTYAWVMGFGPNGDLRFNTATGGRIDLGNGAPVIIPGNVGFNGAQPLAKPTISGSRGGNVALANLLTQLAQYGLITDNTTN